MADDGAGVAAILLRPFHLIDNAVGSPTAEDARYPKALDARAKAPRGAGERTR